MPRLPIDYSKGLIYKIVCKDLTIKECYYGSTTSFSKRKSQHKSNCNNIISKEYISPKYQFIRVNGGWNNWEMILVKNYPCNNKLELEREERLCMEQDNNRLNNILPTRTIKEYRDDNKEYYINYRNDNKYKIKQGKKKYYENNKNNVLNNCKEYYEINKDKIKEQKKEYYKNNKDKLRKKITCECGKTFCYIGKARHYKSKKHQKYLESI